MDNVDNRYHVGMDFTDRYKALGMPYPDPDKMCKGPCEGAGIVPVKGRLTGHGGGEIVPMEPDNPENAELLRLWQQYENESPSDDGWQFVPCPVCSPQLPVNWQKLGTF